MLSRGLQLLLLAAASLIVGAVQRPHLIRSEHAPGRKRFHPHAPKSNSLPDRDSPRSLLEHQRGEAQQALFGSGGDVRPYEVKPQKSLVRSEKKKRKEILADHAALHEDMMSVN